jgi:hypothetical protein
VTPRRAMPDTDELDLVYVELGDDLIKAVDARDVDEPTPLRYGRPPASDVYGRGGRW